MQAHLFYNFRKHGTKFGHLKIIIAHKCVVACINCTDAKVDFWPLKENAFGLTISYLKAL